MKTALTATATLVVLSVASFAQAAPSSGMLLGVYAFPNYQGLRVTGTIHGYSAHGRLYSGDVLKRVTADGFNIYPTYSHGQIEHAKDMIGPNQMASLEIFRPGVGIMYLWVEFQPVGGVAAYTVNGQPQPKQYKARIFTEKEKPGAAMLFKKQQNLNPQPGPQVYPQPGPQVIPQPPINNGGGNGGLGSPGSLFGN